MQCILNSSYRTHKNFHAVPKYMQPGITWLATRQLHIHQYKMPVSGSRQATQWSCWSAGGWSDRFVSGKCSIWRMTPKLRAVNLRPNYKMLPVPLHAGRITLAPLKLIYSSERWGPATDPVMWIYFVAHINCSVQTFIQENQGCLQICSSYTCKHKLSIRLPWSVPCCRSLLC